MGCDIHIIAEVKENGVWRHNTKSVFPNPYFEEGSRDEWRSTRFNINPDDSRNYDWFSVLADVRNGRGFAGVRTGQGFNIISEPRGVPTDASQYWLDYVSKWSCDLHSRSWLSIEDLESFNWNQVTYKEGIITLDQYRELRSKPNSIPKSWSGGIWGNDILVVDTKTADAIIESNGEFPLSAPDSEKDGINNKVINGTNSTSMVLAISEGSVANDFKIQVKYEWQVKYKEWFKSNLENLIGPLKELNKEFEEVRIVFGFDN